MIITSCIYSYLHHGQRRQHVVVHVHGPAHATNFLPLGLVSFWYACSLDPKAHAHALRKLVWVLEEKSSGSNFRIEHNHNHNHMHRLLNVRRKTGILFCYNYRSGHPVDHAAVERITVHIPRCWCGHALLYLTNNPKQANQTKITI